MKRLLYYPNCHDEHCDFHKEYKKNYIKTHRRYMEGKKIRKNLKMRTNVISVNNAKDQNLDTLICCAITKTKNSSTSVDFGSLDKTFIDMSEPELDSDFEQWLEYETLCEKGDSLPFHSNEDDEWLNDIIE